MGLDFQYTLLSLLYYTFPLGIEIYQMKVKLLVSLKYAIY